MVKLPGIEGLDQKDLDEIHALSMVIIAKVLDEVAPNSDQMTLSQIALGSLACKWAGKQLEAHALNGEDV